MIRNWYIIIGLIHYSILSAQIDRKALVHRHLVHIQSIDSLAALTVGNGKFACTVDITGMQSFPAYYTNGVPLSTQSDWAWHTFPNDSAYAFSETIQPYTIGTKTIDFSVQGHTSPRKNRATDYFRSNPHRLHLAQLGLEIRDADGKIIDIDALQDIHQVLNIYSGEISSSFKVGGIPVTVQTVAHPVSDQISYKIHSDLIPLHRLRIKIKIPTPTGAWKDVGNNYLPYQNARSSVSVVKNTIYLHHKIDTSNYTLAINGKLKIETISAHEFVLIPGSHSNVLELNALFTPDKTPLIENFTATVKKSKSSWKKFWHTGAAIDFHRATNTEATELERRIVLSQYLTRVQCTSINPPQETGLTYNSWYGRPHMEMHWWHIMHFAQWNRISIYEKSLDWYFRAFDKAGALASRQGYKGVRWPKMTDPSGTETPSSVGSFLIWQQPHIIYFAEELYKKNKSIASLLKYKQLVLETATCMADMLIWNESKDEFELGPGIIPAQESHEAMQTINPTYELVYWYYGLHTALEWQKRLGLPLNTEWQYKLKKLAKLPEANGLYLAAASAQDSYTNERYMRDHPSVVAALGCLPDMNLVDIHKMSRTLDTILSKWDWHSTWGWDYPMIAMAAAKMGKNKEAINALLMNTQKNTYLKNGHNFQDARLTIYLPGNGALLSAVATLCTYNAWPTDWNVRWEGF